MNIHLEMLKKIGKKVGIHFYENVLSEKNLPLQIPIDQGNFHPKNMTKNIAVLIPENQHTTCNCGS